MNTRQRKTLGAIFAKPALASIRWDHVVSLFRALGADVGEAEGSRVYVELNGVSAVFHRPHPRPTIGRGSVRSVQLFLEEAGIKP